MGDGSGTNAWPWVFGAWGLIVVALGVYSLIVVWSATLKFSEFQVATQATGATAVAEIEEEVAEAEKEVDQLVEGVEGTAPPEGEELAADVEAVQEEVQEAKEEVDLAKPPEVKVEIFGIPWTPSSERLFLWLVVVAGSLGGGVGLAIRSGREDARQWETRRKIWYLAWPVWGAGTALVVYFLIRGGLLNLNLDSASLNPYAVVGISAVVGLGIEPLLDRLTGLFSR